MITEKVGKILTELESEEHQLMIPVEHQDFQLPVELASITIFSHGGNFSMFQRGTMGSFDGGKITKVICIRYFSSSLIAEEIAEDLWTELKTVLPVSGEPAFGKT